MMPLEHSEDTRRLGAGAYHLEEPRVVLPFPYLRHEQRSELIGDGIETEEVEKFFAGSNRVRYGMKGVRIIAICRFSS